LYKLLEPQAELHRRRDLEALKAGVLEIEALVRRLPAGSPHDLRDDLHLAVKGIVTVRQPPKKKPKPELRECGDFDTNVLDDL
jgi:hypothetical protein